MHLDGGDPEFKPLFEATYRGAVTLRHRLEVRRSFGRGRQRAHILVLRPRPTAAPIPSLLATGAVHHHLVGRRSAPRWG